ncbi:MAG: serine/threonine-protein kinase [Planctomycetota bacterium]
MPDNRVGRGQLTELMARREAGAVERFVQDLVGDRYRIERVAGAGGMGFVFSATDTVLQRRVAIKVLNLASGEDGSDAGPDEHERKRILTEARAMAGLRHPNLCRVNEVCLDGSLPFIVMDWIDGLDLRAAWRNTDLRQRLPLFVKIVEAVAAAHGAGVIHADLKPGNVLVDRMGEPIIVDFGLARSLADSPTQRSLIGGTPGYAAPEQFDRQQPLETPADVYALGAMMYEMLTDRLPFTASSHSEVIRLIQEQDPPLPETYAPDAPWPLQRICLAALEREAARRYPDAHALAVDLQRYLRGDTVAARPSVLTDQFFERVEQQLDQVDSWHRQGAVTEVEANRLKRVLGALLRPESHWILDSRRLTVSQVTLYLGGWFALIALVIGLTMTGDLGGPFSSDALARYPAARYVTAWVVAIALFAAGMMIQGRGQRRVSLGYQITACLAVPAAAWLLFRETSWLGEPMVWVSEYTTSDGEIRTSRSNREWLRVFLDVSPSSDSGLLNRQVLIILLAWLAAALGLRRLADSSAFTPFAVVAGALGTVAAWASAGLLEDDERAFALLGVWLLGVGLGALWPGLRLNAREEAKARKHGRVRVRTRDSWAVLLAALLLIGIGLTLMAWNAGDLYTFQLISDESDDATARAVAFIMNGVVLQALSQLLGRHLTVTRGRLAEAIRWVSPSHFLAGLLVLQIDAEEDMWLFWLVVLAAAAVATCYLSVWKQWRPFLLSGLFYIAVAYGRAFSEVAERAENDVVLDQSRLGLAGTMLFLGILTMVLAWKLPDWIATTKLEWWSRN